MKRTILALAALVLLVLGGLAVAATDNFDTYTPGLEAPPANFASVTPADGTDLDYVTRALILDIPGDVKVTTKGGQTVTVPMQAGYNPGRFVRVWDTGTDSGLTIVACW